MKEYAAVGGSLDMMATSMGGSCGSGEETEEIAWSALNAEQRNKRRNNPKRISPKQKTRNGLLYRYKSYACSTRPSPPCCWIGDHMCVLSAFSESAPKERKRVDHTRP